MSDNLLGIIILLGIITVASFGGVKNAQNNSLFSPEPLTKEQKQAQLEQQIRDAQNQVEALKKNMQAQEDSKVYSQYKDIISIQGVNRATKVSYEYVVLRMSNDATSTVNITGWTLKSLSSGNSYTIPEGTYLIFTGSLNTDDPIFLSPGDIAYVSSSVSPNGYSFKVNKCSGYMGQFQTFIPYLNTQCPAPRDENLSSIPDQVINDKCFDFIDGMPSCRIQTDPLPLGLTPECQNFITTKINYGSCVTAHKNDANFYGHEWRIYLKRSDPIWKLSREKIVLYDNLGKIVSTYSY